MTETSLDLVAVETSRLLALGVEVGSALTHGLTMSKMLQACAEALVDQLDAAFARIWTLNEQTSMLELQASAGMYTHLDGPHSRVPLGKLKIGLIAQERKPHLTNQVVGDPRVGNQEWAQRERMVSFAGYPLSIGERVVGVMALFARHPLPDSTLQTLAGLADGIAVGVERLSKDAALRKNQDQIRVQTAALEAAANAFMIADANGTIQWVNPAFTALTGYSPSEAIGQTPRFLKSGHQSRSFYTELWRTITEGRVWKGELVNRRKDGSLYHEESTITPVRGSNGGVTHFIAIKQDISERKRAEALMRELHERVVQTSRQAGMAEVATTVLHNVGNVLNSVNVSTSLLEERARASRCSDLGRLGSLLKEHQTDLAGFLTADRRGRMVPVFIAKLAEQLAREQAVLTTELSELRRNVEHIKSIVAMQQEHAKISGLREITAVTDLVEAALKLNEASFASRKVTVAREYECGPKINTDRHKVLQILVNLLSNARHACAESGKPEQQIVVRIGEDGDRVFISVSDNGVGISSENLARVFNHGFTTRKDGHGFGLHGGALSARELGGTLAVRSEGLGHGAVFTLALPKDYPLSARREVEAVGNLIG